MSLAEVFQLGYYWETKILLTAVKLDVFSVLDGRGRTTAEAAEKLGADVRALELLLNALVAIMDAVAIKARLPVIRQTLAPGQCISLNVKPVVSRNVVAKPLKNRILFIVSCL